MIIKTNIEDLIFKINPSSTYLNKEYILENMENYINSEQNSLELTFYFD